MFTQNIRKIRICTRNTRNATVFGPKHVKNIEFLFKIFNPSRHTVFWGHVLKSSSVLHRTFAKKRVSPPTKKSIHYAGEKTISHFVFPLVWTKTGAWQFFPPPPLFPGQKLVNQKNTFYFSMFHTSQKTLFRIISIYILPWKNK